MAGLEVDGGPSVSIGRPADASLTLFAARPGDGGGAWVPMLLEAGGLSARMTADAAGWMGGSAALVAYFESLAHDGVAGRHAGVVRRLSRSHLERAS